MEQISGRLGEVSDRTLRLVVMGVLGLGTLATCTVADEVVRFEQLDRCGDTYDALATEDIETRNSEVSWWQLADDLVDCVEGAEGFIAGWPPEISLGR